MNSQVFELPLWEGRRNGQQREAGPGSLPYAPRDFLTASNFSKPSKKVVQRGRRGAALPSAE